ncbi:hypothetical protein BMAGN_0372 [Bifidobacterium magnum]|uniref:Uncharacterized protein n=1 Tax=Bifidobacterium magnum TaxID=1692 RepID=A0A087BBL1_9BIFI|nr:hypothetical protein BMAGN_0372 [Bifidobacterium magnum]
MRQPITRQKHCISSPREEHHTARTATSKTEALPYESGRTIGLPPTIRPLHTCTNLCEPARPLAPHIRQFVLLSSLPHMTGRSSRFAATATRRIHLGPLGEALPYFHISPRPTSPAIPRHAHFLGATFTRLLPSTVCLRPCRKRLLNGFLSPFVTANQHLPLRLQATCTRFHGFNHSHAHTALGRTDPLPWHLQVPPPLEYVEEEYGDICLHIVHL